MPNTIGKGVVEVVYDKGQAEKSAREAILPGLGRVAGDMAGVFAGKKIFDFAKQGFAELGEAQKVSALTASTLKATGSAANVTADQVSGLAGELSNLSGKDDELIQSGENLLLTFKAVRNEAGAGNDVFNQATKAALDLSTAGFGSMESASVMLGKALNDPIKGVTALQRVGVSLTDAQKEQVKAFVEAGDVLSAQKVILGEVEAQVGGAAAAYGQTLPGQLERANNAMDEAKAAMDGGLAPALSLGADAATFLATEVTKLPEPLQALVGITALLGGGIAAVARPVHDLINLFRIMKPAALEATVAVEANALAQNSSASVSNLYAGKTSSLSSTLGKAGLVAAAAAATFGIYEYGKSLNKTSLDSEELARITKLTGGELIAKMDSVAAVSKGPFAHAFDDAIKGLADKGPEGIGVLSQMRDHYAAIGDSEHLGKVDAAIKSTAESQKNLTTNQEAGNAAMDDAVPPIDRHTEALERTKKALDDYANAQKASIDPLFASLNAFQANARAQDDLVRAQDDLTTAVAKYGVNSREAEDARRKLNDADESAVSTAIDLKIASEDLTNKILNGNLSVQDAKDQLGLWVQQGLITESTAGAIGAEFDVVAAKAAALQGKDITMQMHLDDAQVQAALSRIGQLVIKGPNGELSIDADLRTSSGGRFKAAGGHVDAHTPYVVGEFRPELFVPDVAGTIVPRVPDLKLPAFNDVGAAGWTDRPLVIEVPLYLNDREFARATVHATADELRRRDRALR